MADGLVLPGTGLTVATDDISSQHYQRIKLQVGANGLATDFLHKISRQDTFTGAGSGTALDLSAQAMSLFSLQLTGTGATPSAWVFAIDVSNDNSIYTPAAMLSNAEGTTEDVPHTVRTANGKMGWTTQAIAVMYVRTRCVSLTLNLATNVVATLLAKDH